VKQLRLPGLTTSNPHAVYSLLQEAARQLGRTQADVEAALHATPLHSALADLLHACSAAGGDQAVDIVVLSDANTVRKGST
jgi:hypothetical protein